jgi:PadR family transcriptional regulator PadR
MTKEQEHRDLFPGALELMILQTLHRKPMHGYALAQHIKAVSDELESEMGVSARNRPVRIYKVTAAGAKRLEEEISSFEKMFAGINRVLALG